MKYLFLIFIIIFFARFHQPIPIIPPQKSNIIGVIASIPESHPNYIQFLFNPNHTKNKLLLRWYAPPPIHLRIGDEWELKIKTKNNKGNVEMDFKNQLIQKHPWAYPIDHIRELIYMKIKNTLTADQGLGFISALTIGMRDNITESQWNDLRGTGTNHLMAIAGLHIGFISLMAYSLINLLWRRYYRLMLLIPAQEAATIASLIAAFLYSALAGFSLPTQRAIIMLSVFLLTSLLRIKISPWSSYFLALGIILAYEPLSIITPTLWLSFTAVALLIYGHSGRIGKQPWWWHITRAQWIMALGLIPLSLLFFQQISFVGFIANCLAIPFVGFIILPLCLLSFWKFAGFLLMKFWVIIHWLATIPHSQYYNYDINYFNLISLFLAVILLLAPRGWPHRWIGLLGFLPLVLHQNPI